MSREESTALRKQLDLAEEYAAAARVSHAAALQRLRDACPHAGTAVELYLHWQKHAMGMATMFRHFRAARFCLECGAMEDLTTMKREGLEPAFEFQKIVRATRLHRTDCKHPAFFNAQLEPYAKRLHEEGRFEEFDANGKWIGPAERIVLGVD